MTREFISGVGGNNDDFRLHLTATSAQAQAGVTFPVQTADAAPAPDGDRWIAFDNTAIDFNMAGMSSAVTPKTYQWACCNALRVRGTLGVGENDIIVLFGTDSGTGSLQLEWVRVAAGTFNLRLTWDVARNILATGTTVYAVDTSYSWRIQCDGATVKLCVNGSSPPEIEAAFPGRINNRTIKLYAPNAATQIHYWSRIVVCQSASFADRPDEAAEMQELEPDTVAGIYEQEWGNHDDCSQAETTAIPDDVDLDGNDQVEQTQYWCENAGDTGDCSSEIEDPDAFAGTILGVTQYVVVRANAGGKTVAWNFRQHNGVDSSEQAGTNLGDITWRGQAAVFADPLTGGNTWEDEIDNLKSGASATSSNTANIQLAGLIDKVFAVGDDPPGVEEPEVSPLPAAAFGSANPMVY